MNTPTIDPITALSLLLTTTVLLTALTLTYLFITVGL